MFISVNGMPVKILSGHGNNDETLFGVIFGDIEHHNFL